MDDWLMGMQLIKGGIVPNCVQWSALITVSARIPLQNRSFQMHIVQLS